MAYEEVRGPNDPNGPPHSPNEGRSIWNRVIRELFDLLPQKADLGADGKVPTSHLPDTVLGGLDYQGGWDAQANAPDLVAALKTKGDYWKVTAAGSTALSGINDWQTGDWAVWNGAAFDKVDNSEAGAAVPDATEATAGKAEIATQPETDADADDSRIVTPLKLARRLYRALRHLSTDPATPADGETWIRADLATPELRARIDGTTKTLGGGSSGSLPVLTADPAAPPDGSAWLRGDLAPPQVRYRVGGATYFEELTAVPAAATSHGVVLANDATPVVPSALYIARTVVPQVAGISVTGGTVLSTVDGATYALKVLSGAAVVASKAFVGNGGTVEVAFDAPLALTSGASYEFGYSSAASANMRFADSDFGASTADFALGVGVFASSEDGQAGRGTGDAFSINATMRYAK